MFCAQCGDTIHHNDKFCKCCGTPVYWIADSIIKYRCLECDSITTLPYNRSIRFCPFCCSDELEKTKDKLIIEQIRADSKMERALIRKETQVQAAQAYRDAEISEQRYKDRKNKRELIFSLLLIGLVALCMFFMLIAANV